MYTFQLFLAWFAGIGLVCTWRGLTFYARSIRRKYAELRPQRNRFASVMASLVL